jgi:hypothetical protein
MTTYTKAQFDSDITTIKALMASPVQSWEVKRVTSLRISHASGHIASLRQFANNKPGRVHDIVTDLANSLEATLVEALEVVS